MASAASSRNSASDPTANVGYYEEYSDPDLDPRQPPNPHHDEADEDDEDEEDEEEDDFITRPRRDSPPPIPYQPAPSHDNNNALKRKASDPTRPPPSTRAANGGAVVDSGHTTKRPRPEPLEPSILCAEPLDEFVQEIADWVWRVSQGRDNIEVSAFGSCAWLEVLTRFDCNTGGSQGRHDRRHAPKCPSKSARVK